MILPRPKAGEPPGVSILRTIKGHEDCNEATEVLEMLKGGFGLIDAPNLFTSRVDEIFVAHGAKPTTAEPKIDLRMTSSDKDGRSGRGGSATSSTALDLMVSAHMDDFKATGQQSS